MSDRLSSRSIYHFTNSLEKLSIILANGFRPYCCIEVKENEKAAIPMVSFCDIPLSQIDSHVRKYGCYGLGLCKKWAIENNITPVMYRAKFGSHQDSYNQLFALLETLGEMKLEEEVNENFLLLKERFTYFSWLIKSYEGREHHKDQKIEFYNEREWRYIPDFNELIKNKLPPSSFNHYVKEMQKKFNKVLSQTFCLKFELDDLQYIIVKEEEDIDKILEISDIFKLSSSEKLKFMTKLLTMDKIRNDF